MKKLILTVTGPVLLLTGALLLALIPTCLHASPYASGLTNNAGTVSFYLNEGGGNVTVTYEDGSTNANFNGLSTGTNLPSGLQSFSLVGHTSYAISVFKIGSGTPTQISVDATPGCLWPAPRGVSVNENAANGRWFGRVYVDNSSPGDSGANAKYRGVYAFNPDLTEALGHGTNPAGTSAFTTASSSSPWRLRVAPDNTLLVGDFSTANAGLWQFAPDLSSSNLVLSIVGENAAIAAGIHGDMFGTARLSGSLAQSNLVLWVADGGLAVPAGTTLGPGTAVGNYNCLYRYDIGAGPLPWNQAPNYAYTVGLSGIAELDPEVDIGKDGKIFAGFYRANLSNPDIQILDPTGSTVLWTSWIDTGGATDPWSGLINGFDNSVSAQDGSYAGVRVSPDGRFLASVGVKNDITIANLTNGLPDDASIFGIPNASNVGNARGMDWDAADNIYVVSSGQGLMRVYSLGLTTTCITRNDLTGTNGSFQLILPPVTATVMATTPVASQNYINNASPGTPIPGVFTISLSTNSLPAPTVVTFFPYGSAALNTNYTIKTGTDLNGAIITTTNVTFPAGAYPGGGNWSVNVPVVPTAMPVSGPTLAIGMRLIGGSSFLAGTPGYAVVGIQNTGPQLLILSNAPSGATMSRNVSGDYAKFLVTRWGDTNGPGNSAGSVNQVTYTVTNLTYGGTAAFPVDYTAQSQRGDAPAYNGILQSPMDGSPGIVINPGDITVPAVIGNPIRHTNLSAPPVNVTITINPTNGVTGTNATSAEGFAYSVIPAGVTLTELDNTIGSEVVLWSDPLTNSLTSTNWTLTFASTNFAAFSVLPVVLPNYTNDESALATGGTNDFRVEFGTPVSTDGIAPSPDMIANGWSNVLRMTVNKDGSFSQAGVNLFPHSQSFAGNYALRFSMYLSMYSAANNNPNSGSYPYEFALFGVNHAGTNCDWRTSFNIPANPGYAAPTNADGIWFAIDAGSGSITPADFDAFASPALPNSGVAADFVSNTAQSQNGVFKSPPFVSENLPGSTAGGQPIDQWVDVSVEITLHTNISVYMNRSQVIPSFSITNGGGNYLSGKVMLGYLDPVPNESDSSAFVYYSNVRVVELAPYIYAQPSSLIVTQGANVSFTSSTWLGTPTITNIWYAANTTPTPVLALQTNTASATNLTSTLALNNVQFGTNYQLVASDPAGYETGVVASLEVIIGPTNQTVSAGTNFVQFVAIPSGPSAPTAYQWKANGVNLANGSHFAGVTTSTLTITNAQLSDAATYTVTVSNPAGVVAPSATLTVNAPQPAFATISLVGTNALLNFTTSNPYDNTGSFTLQSSVNVQGPYANTAGTVTGGSGSFQFTVPLTTNSTLFYRLKHN